MDIILDTVRRLDSLYPTLVDFSGTWGGGGEFQIRFLQFYDFHWQVFCSYLTNCSEKNMHYPQSREPHGNQNKNECAGEGQQEFTRPDFVVQ
jgi:hypothetical protein